MRLASVKHYELRRAPCAVPRTCARRCGPPSLSEGAWIATESNPPPCMFIWVDSPYPPFSTRLRSWTAAIRWRNAAGATSSLWSVPAPLVQRLNMKMHSCWRSDRYKLDLVTDWGRRFCLWHTSCAVSVYQWFFCWVRSCWRSWTGTSWDLLGGPFGAYTVSCWLRELLIT